MQVSVASVMSLARVYADERPGGSSSFVSDNELTNIVEVEAAELYDLLVAARGHEYAKSVDTDVTASGTASYALPSDFYQLLRLELSWGAQDIELVQPFEQLEAHVFKNIGEWGQDSCKGFRIQGQFFELVPTPTSVVSYSLHYIPILGTLTSESTIDSVNGWHDAVAMGAAAKLCVIDGRLDQARVWREEKERTVQRIREMADDRAATQPNRVVDVEAMATAGPWDRYYGRPTW